MASNNSCNFDEGTSGKVLTSNGAGVAPTFQAAGGGGPADIGLIVSGQVYGTGINGSSSTTQALTAGRIYLSTLYLPFDFEMDQISFNVTAAASAGKSARVGIYNLSSDNQPGTVNRTFGTAAIDSNGVKSVADTTTITSGFHFLAIQVEESATISFMFNPMSWAFPKISTTNIGVRVPFFTGSWGAALPDLTAAAPGGYTNAKIAYLTIRKS